MKHLYFFMFTSCVGEGVYDAPQNTRPGFHVQRQLVDNLEESVLCTVRFWKSNSGHPQSITGELPWEAGSIKDHKSERWKAVGLQLSYEASAHPRLRPSLPPSSYVNWQFPLPAPAGLSWCTVSCNQKIPEWNSVDLKGKKKTLIPAQETEEHGRSRCGWGWNFTICSK